METLNFDDREVVIKTFETKAPAGRLAAANLDAASIRSLLPIIHEVSQRHFQDAISSLSETTIDTIRVEFTLQAMESEHMIVLIQALIKQAINLHDERERNRSRQDHPSNPDGLVVISHDRYHKGAKSPFTNVPPRLRRLR